MPPPAPRSILRFDAAAVADASGCLAPGSLLLEAADPSIRPDGSLHASLRTLALGPPRVVDAHPLAAAATPRDLPGHLLLPGLVNAHTHLDLTAIGPQQHDPSHGFAPFIELVRARRPSDPADIAAAVATGVDRSLSAGVVAVGDIAGAPGGRPSAAAFDALAASPIHGVGFLEFFAIGRTQPAALSIVADLVASHRSPPRRVRLGLSPHATYSVSPSAYREAFGLAATHDLPVVTHLAETPEEHQFIAQATGPQRALLEAVRAWDDALLAEFGHGRTPIAHLARAIGGSTRTALAFAHVHDLGPDLDALASTGASVLYCPRAAAYFASPDRFGPHAYRAMLARGINVALGTDSVINLPTPDLNVWDEARLLFARDDTDPLTLLRMATVNGALALGLPETAFRFAPGQPLAGLASIPIDPRSAEPLRAALSGSRGPFLLCLGK